MVAYTGYESDNRVRRYAEALAQRGDTVDVVALRLEGQSSKDVLNGVRIFRIQRRVRNEKGRFAYLGKLLLFFLRSMLFLTREQIRERYEIIHVHSIPDFEVFAALYAKLTGSKIILDIHDIMPEFYASKFHAPQGLTFRLLVAVERMSAAFSDHVIAANHIWQDRLQQRSVSNSKCTTILNFPDTEIFRRHGKVRSGNKFVVIYPGTLSYHQGLDIAIRAFARVKDEIPEAEFHIYGSGDQLDLLKSLIVHLGLEDRVLPKGVLPLHEISRVMENADLGVVPKRKNGFGNEAFSTKILEFMALGVPVIIPDTMIDRYYFNDSIVRFFQANDEQSLADAMLEMFKCPELRQRLVGNADEFIKRYTWQENKNVYLNLVDSLVTVQNENKPHVTGNINS
jgi:glycosyltransferase involved in cell wall biosynthesis